MATITLDIDPHFEKMHFQDAEELLAFLNAKFGGFLNEDNEGLEKELEKRLTQMEENPDLIISVQEAIAHARTGK